MTRRDRPPGTQRDGPDQDRPTRHRATASRTPAVTVDHPAAHAERIDVDAFRAELRAGRDQWCRRWNQWQRHRDQWQRRAASRGLTTLIGCGLAGRVRFIASDFGLTRSGVIREARQHIVQDEWQRWEIDAALTPPDRVPPDGWGR